MLLFGVVACLIVQVLDLLQPVKDAFPHTSLADLIVLAGVTALTTDCDVPNLKYCGGRVDADPYDPNNQLLSILDPDLREYETVIIGVRDRMKIAGLTVPQMVALAGRPRSASLMMARGFSGSYTSDEAPRKCDVFCVRFCARRRVL